MRATRFTFFEAAGWAALGGGSREHRRPAAYGDSRNRRAGRIGDHRRAPRAWTASCSARRACANYDAAGWRAHFSLVAGTGREAEDVVLDEWAELHDTVLGYPPNW